MKRRPSHVVAALLLGVALAAPTGMAGASHAPSHDIRTYATMSDGIMIALGVRLPADYSPTEKYGTLFQMDGYAGGGGYFSSTKYVTVYASIRGTGCSGGRFDLFDRRHAEDGKEIIDEWLPRQPWFNGKVGIVGYSYPALTGFLVASTRPKNLTVTAIGGLIDDLYRGIVYPGGVPNFGFPAIWTGAFRPAFEAAGNASRWASGDPVCYANMASRPAGDPFENPFIRGATQQEDGPWWHHRSLYTWASRIDKPIHMTHHYQDEQTGPRGGPAIWQQVPETTPKRLVMTNGRHGRSGAESADMNAWLDCWLLHDGEAEACAPGMRDDAQRVRVHFETAGNAQNDALVGGDFPLPQTAWTEYFLRENGSITTAAPDGEEATRTYVSTPRGRQGANGVNAATAANGPDELSYVLNFGAPTAIAGPITLNLWATATGPEVDFMVTLIDRRPDGQVEVLQRGLLRGSHRAVDQLRSNRIADGPFAGRIYRPHRPHTNPLAVVPGTATEYLVEIFPLGHVFRSGHKLLLKISPPAAQDPISELYTYPHVSTSPAVTIHHDPAHAASLLLPVMPDLPPLSSARNCGAQSGVRCTTPAI